MKRNVILRVAVAVETSEVNAKKTAELAAAHVKNCLMDNPNVDETTIENVDVVVLNDGGEPAKKMGKVYDIELPNGTPAKITNNPNVDGHYGIDVIVDDKVIVSIPFLCAVDVYCDEDWYNRFVEDYNYHMSAKGRVMINYHKYKAEKGHAPTFASVHVQFKGEDHGDDVVIKLQPSTEEEQNGEGDDNQIFFYCNGVEELARLTSEHSGEDFVVTDFFHYFDEL